MSDIKLPDHCIGSKFRPVHWHDIQSGAAVLIGWGIEEKPPGQRRYTPRGYRGQLHPFKTKGEAQKVCDELNAQAAHPATKEPR